MHSPAHNPVPPASREVPPRGAPRGRCHVKRVLIYREGIILEVGIEGDAALLQQIVLRTSRIVRGPSGNGGPRWEDRPCTAVHGARGGARLTFGLDPSIDTVHSAEVIAPPGLDLSTETRVQEMLGGVFPTTDKEFERLFMGRGLRWDDARSNHFIARQIALDFPGSSYYRCAAAVVLCYKAAEFDDPSDTGDALEIAHALLPVARSCRRHWHPRKNGEHLHLSLLTALWHVHIARSDIHALLGTLQTIKDEIPHIANFFTPSLNLGKSLLIYGYVLHRKGLSSESQEAFRLVVDVYQRAVAHLDIRRVALVAELAVTQRAAVLAAAAVRSLVPGGPADLDGEAIFAEALRFGGNAAARLSRRLQADLAA